MKISQAYSKQTISRKRKATFIEMSNHYTTEEADPEPVKPQDEAQQQLKHPLTHGRPPFSYVRDEDCKWFGYQMSFLFRDPDEVFECASRLRTWATLDTRRLIVEALELNPELLNDLPQAIQKFLPPHLKPDTRAVTLGQRYPRKWALERHPDWVERLYSFQERNNLWTVRDEQEAVQYGSFYSKNGQIKRVRRLDEQIEDEHDEDEHDEQYEVETLLQAKYQAGRVKYLVQWRPIKTQTFEPSWEPATNVTSDLITDYWRRFYQQMVCNENLSAMKVPWIAKEVSKVKPTP